MIPSESKPFEAFFDPELAVKRSSRLARSEAKIPSMLSTGASYANTFNPKHALDLLAPRLISVQITGLSLKERAHNVLRGIRRAKE
jgi:hypothetical protein